MQENTILTSVGSIVAFSLFLMTVLTWARYKIADVTIRWLRGPYERSLHDAAWEFYRTEQWKEACGNWRKNFKLIEGLRLYWIPGVRKSLDSLHADKMQQLAGAVDIVAIPRSITDIRVRPWTITLLDSNGKGVGSLDHWSRLRSEDPAALLQVFQNHSIAASLLIEDQNGLVVNQIEREEVMRPSASSTGGD